MSIDFPFILLNLTAIAGVISLVDIIFWASKRKKQKINKPPIVIEYARSFFLVLLAVFLIRSFVAQPYKVPSGSLEPTILPGDFILVSQFSYGLRLPIWNKKLVAYKEPKTGDITVFHWPVNPAIDFIKRVIGVPGDHISYINKVLYVNGKKATQKFIGFADNNDKNGPSCRMKIIEENLNGVKHKIYICPNQKGENFYNLVVPQGQYFMMGDNRDESEDSRFWGFVPDKDIVGKALLVWLSWDSDNHTLRWHRIGQGI